MSGRRLVITGAGGFVGRCLARGFVELGWDVIGVDRAFDADSEGDGVERVTADLARGVPARVPSDPGAVHVVVHAAWVTTDPANLGISRSTYSEHNLRPLRVVLEYAARARPAAFVFLSSSGVFAPGDGIAGLTDDVVPTGASAYATAKRAGEALVAQASARVAACHVARLGYLFGPNEAARPSRESVSTVARWIGAARVGASLGVRSDDPLRDWTYAPDLAAAMERLVDGPAAAAPVHLGSPHVWRDRALAGLVAKRFPGVKLVTEDAQTAMKPPMIPSRIPALAGFPWTDPAAGLDALLAREVPA